MKRRWLDYLDLNFDFDLTLISIPIATSISRRNSVEDFLAHLES
jgi:hypothetical protein